MITLRCPTETGCKGQVVILFTTCLSVICRAQESPWFSPESICSLRIPLRQKRVGCYTLCVFVGVYRALKELVKIKWHQAREM